MKIWHFFIVLFCFALVIVNTWSIRRQFLAKAKRQNYDLRLYMQEQYWSHINQSLEKLPANNEKKLDAEEQLASVLALEHQYKLATFLYKTVWRERMKTITRKYNPRIVHTLQSMAFLDLDLGNIEACEDCYKSAWDYDKTRLAAGDARVTRDLNNLGVLYYLLATVTTDRLQRQLQFERSNFFLLQALMSSRQAPDHDTERQANILDNQYLVLRDTERLQQAQAVKRQAESLHYLIPGRFNAP
jgi:hypothetical protein